MRIRTRNDLIKIIEDSYLCKAYPRIGRALVEGTNENLGIFRFIPCTPANTACGLIVAIKGKRNEWIIAVKPKRFEDYMCYILRKVPWEYWEGDDRLHQVFQGDDPKKYKLLREKEKINEKSTDC